MLTKGGEELMARRNGNGGWIGFLIVAAAVSTGLYKLKYRRCPNCKTAFTALEILSAVACPQCGRLVGAVEALVA